MTRQDTIEVLGVLQIAYPSFYRGQTGQQANETIDLWASLFADDDPQLVREAVRRLITTRTESWPPTIGAVKAEMVKIARPEISERTEMEAWGLVRKALRNGAYHAASEWEKLPEDVQKCVTPELLHAWAIDEEFNESVIMSQFMRSYRARTGRSVENDMIPASTRELTDRYRGYAALPETKGRKHESDDDI